jgi:hypothetical protein
MRTLTTLIATLWLAGCVYGQENPVQQPKPQMLIADGGISSYCVLQVTVPKGRQAQELLTQAALVRAHWPKAEVSEVRVLIGDDEQFSLTLSQFEAALRRAARRAAGCKRALKNAEKLTPVAFHRMPVK